MRGGDAGNMALFLVELHNLAGATATHRTPCVTGDAAAVKPTDLEPGLGRAISHVRPWVSACLSLDLGTSLCGKRVELGQHFPNCCLQPFTRWSNRFSESGPVKGGLTLDVLAPAPKQDLDPKLILFLAVDQGKVNPQANYF